MFGDKSNSGPWFDAMGEQDKLGYATQQMLPVLSVLVIFDGIIIEERSNLCLRLITFSRWDADFCPSISTMPRDRPAMWLMRLLRHMLGTHRTGCS
jgi:hypothetical protein